MNELFNPDGVFATYGTKAFNILFLSITFTALSFFSLGILMGYASVGMHKSIYACVTPNNGFAPFYFFRPLKEIKKRWPVLLVAPLLSYLVIFSSAFAIMMILYGEMSTMFMLPIYILLFIEASFVSQYVFPLVAHTKIGFKALFYYSFGIANKHLLISFIGLLSNMIAVALVVWCTFSLPQLVPLFLFVLPTITFSLSSHLIVKKVLPNYELERFDLNIEA